VTSPPLKTDPKFGYFPRWPEDGNDWLHPDDVALARTLIPSGRIFRRDGTGGEYQLFHYGDIRLRARPALWQEVAHEGLDIGDWVEVKSLGMRNEPRTGVIREVLWNETTRRVAYQITENNNLIADLYTREDLQRVEPTSPPSAPGSAGG
jgi:hypothetical protein